MAHDVFISYSTKDKLAADAVCARLEGRGIRCWIAPRDILPGMDWGASIIEALESARLMVVVFSSNANASLQIRREVECAFSKEILVVPLRIEDVPPGRSLEYFLGNVHWLDAISPPFEQHLDRIGDTIKLLIGRMPDAVSEPVNRSGAASTQSEAGAEEQARRAAAAASVNEARAQETQPQSPPLDQSRTRAKSRYGLIIIFPVLALAMLVVWYWSERSTTAPVAASAESSPDQGAAARQVASPVAQAATKVDEQVRQKHASDEAAFCANFKDCGEALKEFRNRAMQGNADAQSKLGDMYYYGYGVEPDYAQSLNWYRQAAAQGSAYGQYSVGYLYQFGQGVERNYSEALNWYRQSAAQGNADAENHLGDMYYYGYGVDPDYAKSLDWYRQAAAQGSAYGQYSIGYMYQNGRGVERNDAEALNWYRKAAAQGNADAQKMVDQLSASGH